MIKLKHFALPFAAGIIAVTVLKSCMTGIPEGAQAVRNFSAEKYLGKWYEIARFDFRFEKDLNNVTATYSLLENGHIKVDNRGYNYITKEWKQSIGEARFIENENVARLKVSFFKPIWAGYNVIDIDEDYRYALIAGNNLDYLWILSREKTIPDDIKERFLNKAKSIGFKTGNLIWVEHTEE